MTKRVSLKQRRAGDAKGIDSIFQGPAEVQKSLPNKPESQRVTGQGASSAPEVSASEQSGTSSSPSATGKSGETPSSKPVLSKATVYIRPEQVVAIEAIQLAERQRSGVKPDKSDLMQEALDLLIEKYGTA